MAENIINSINLYQKNSFPYLVLNVKGMAAFPHNPGFRTWHWHKDLQFIFISKGPIIFSTLENKNIILNSNEGLFINKNQIHLIEPTTQSNYHSFIFPEKFLDFYLNSPANTTVNKLINNQNFNFVHLLPNISWHRKILELLKKLTTLDDRNSNLYPYQVLVNLHNIWLLMQENIDLPTDIPNNNLTKERIYIFLNYIHHHFAEKITITSISNSAHVSKSECLRCFHSTLNITPYEYLLNYRLQKSIILLQNSDSNITDIANKVGFNQPSHFIAILKKRIGKTPKQFRNLQ